MRMAWTCSQARRPSRKTLMWENTLTKTHIESRTDQNGKRTNNGTQFAPLRMQQFSPNESRGDHIVAPQDKNQLDGTYFHASTRECPIHKRISAGCSPSCRMYANRETWSQSWPLDQPILCGPKVDSDTKSMNIRTRTENHRLALHTNQCGDNIVTTLVENQSGGIHPRAPTI